MVTALIKSMRPKQWTKNTAIFAALIFDRQLFNLNSDLRALAGFILFCFISSAVYIFNDIIDVESDKKHPTKRLRPIASGQLPISIALPFGLIFTISSLIAGFWLSPVFGILETIYFLINLAYSKWLKHIVILDVIIIAFGFVLRVASGVSLVNVERFSPWLYVVTTLLALYLGFGKRRSEISLLNADAVHHRRVLDGYTLPFLDQMITIVSSTTIIAYSLYTFSAPNLPADHTMMLTIPFVLYGVFRYLYLIQVKHAGGAPEELLLTDRPLQLTIIFFGILILVIFYSNSLFLRLFG
jgi:4-hydroxybenzoate polyprenyltransferase